MNHDKEFEKRLKKVEKPARYIGGEINEIKKNPLECTLRFGFAFPDIYEIGMSYLGLQLLYHLLNQEEEIYCERVFAPGQDMEALMRKEGVPLFTLETKTPVRELDMLGFTLQYELSYTNILNMLSLSGIPFFSKDRKEDMPFLIGGGPCAYNPEPLADIFDLFLIGDGEESLIQLCKLYESWKASGEDRQDFLKKACLLTGVYVPSFYEPVYRQDGCIKEIKKHFPEAPDTVQKSIVSDINTVRFPERPIVPLIQTVHDRAVVETFRGCFRGCRFCQAGMIYRPVRERTKENIVQIAKNQLQNTGHEELSLLSLSTSDYSDFEPLVTELMGFCREENVSLSLPSLRLDSFSFKVLDEISGYKKTGLTFAPEAGSQRLRDVINKRITEEDIYGSLRQAIELGYSTIKLYFMIGLPTETDEDLGEIAAMVQKIMEINQMIKGPKGNRLKVTASISNFVPKAHTPFQWAPQDTVQEFIRKHDYLKQKLKMKNVSFHYHESNTSILEAVFARGDRKVIPALIRAYELGCKFDGWSEHFHWDLWEKAFCETNVDIEFYTSRERGYEEVLPWDIIDCSVSKAYLIQENEKAMQASITSDCREKCSNCGINKRVLCGKETS